MPLRSLAALLAGIAVVFAGSVAPVRAGDAAILVPDVDPEMAVAIAKARETLPEFWQARESDEPNVDGFALKVCIPYGDNQGEHVWLTDIQRIGNSYSGIVSNEPDDATQVHKGQRYDFRDPDISDWLFMRNGKMVGNRTMRPLLKRMKKKEAAEYRRMYETP